LLSIELFLRPKGRFQEAAALAVSSQTTAQNAMVPPDYTRSIALIAQAEGLRDHVQALRSAKSAELTSYGNNQLNLAKQSFIAKNFTLARQEAQEAIDAYNRAKQIDFDESIVAWLGNISLIVPVMILVILLRHQLRSG